MISTFTHVEGWRYVALLVIWLCCGVGVNVQGAVEQEATAGAGEPVQIHIATEEYPPYTSEYMLDHGIDCHIVTEAFKLRGIEAVYHFYPASRSYGLAKAGEIDATLPWAKRADRLKDFLYTQPVIESDREHLYYLKGTVVQWSAKTQDYAALKDVTFGAIHSYNYGEAFQKAEADGVIQVERVTTLEQNFKKLLAGRIDVVISQERIANYELIKRFDATQIARIDHQPENVRPAAYDYMILSKKREHAGFFQNEFNAGMAELKKSGRYAQLIKALGTPQYILENTTPETPEKQ